jgi:serine/threonine protein kinase
MAHKAIYQPGDNIFGDFEVLGLAGEGATSYVYRCATRPGRVPALPPIVAVKVLHNRFVYDPVARARFLTEGQLMLGLSHPNVVSVFELLDAPGNVAFVMEHVEGPSLLEWQARNPGPRTDQELCEIFIDILRGVGYTHKRGVIHRDLKPANILLDTTGERPIARLIDFGVARPSDAPPTPEELKAIRGTAAYISPDELRSPYEVCESSDLYSLGVILYELAAGTRPFHATTPQALFQAHLHADPTPPSAVNPELQPALEAVILQALAKRPEHRFADAGALQGALEQALSVAWEIRTAQWARPTLPPPSPALRARLMGQGPRTMLQAFVMMILFVLNPGTTDQVGDPHYLSRPFVALPGLL